MANNTFQNVTINPSSPIACGTSSVSVAVTINSAALERVTDPAVTVSLKTPCCAPQTEAATQNTDGSFTATLPTWMLQPGLYEVEAKLTGTVQDVPETASEYVTFTVTEVRKPGEQPTEPISSPCIPCSDPIATVNRVLRDRKVSKAVTELIGSAAKDFPQIDNLPSVKGALEGIAKAFAGTDAVQAKGTPCLGQLCLQVYMRDPATGKHELLKPALAQRINVQLINSRNEVAEYTRADIEDRGIVFNGVGEGEIVVSFPEKFVEEAELSQLFDVRSPFDKHFKRFTTAKPPANTNTPTGGQSSSSTDSKEPGTAATDAEIAARLDRLDESVDELYGQRIGSIGTNLPSGHEPFAFGTPTPTSGALTARIVRGGQTVMRCFLNPASAHVRCFSWLEGDGASCLPGKQYVSCISISVWRGDRRVICNPTSDSGCTSFKLSPGWYTFTAPEEVLVEGCTYALTTSSPISAFLAAKQRCSDIYFRYKKKGSEIEVISEILYPDPGNPYVTAKNVFAGMEYLLLSENNPSFVQQQATSDGSPVSFRNLAAGPYLLFCQAPATYNSQPVQPVYPAGGRLALTVFGGQVSAVPVQVKFKSGITAPAVLDGYVRDDTGQPIVGQVVLIVNNAGCIIAAGVTDDTGQYSIQVYNAENITIVVGAQQVTVSKAQIQQAMKMVGTAALPSPNASMDLAMQTADLVGFNN